MTRLSNSGVRWATWLICCTNRSIFKIQGKKYAYIITNLNIRIKKQTDVMKSVIVCMILLMPGSIFVVFAIYEAILSW